MQTLLVDDDAISIFLAEKVFQQADVGWGLRSFKSPELGLAHVLQALEEEQLPDVILLDLNMPVLNGWDFLAALHPYEAQLTGRCFIYLLTSSLAPADKARARELSLVTDFIAKPLDSHQVQTIQTHVLEYQR